MKVLIWIVCFFVQGMIITLFKNSGIILGALPTMALFGFTLWLARTLCKKYDEHKEQKSSSQNIEEENKDNK